MLALLATAGSAQEAPPADDGYTYSAPEHFGTGKAFMGRPIANVVDVNGAEWFDRSARQQEEGTDKLLPLLGIRPTDVIADIGAGTGYFTFRMARLAPQGRVYAEDIQQGMLDIIARHQASDPAANVQTVLGTATDPRLPAGSLEPVLFRWMRRDGADFGSVQDARRGAMRRIVTPKALGSQRRTGPKSARRFAVALGSPPDGVTLLARATSPHCATFLAGELPRAITAYPPKQDRL